MICLSGLVGLCALGACGFSADLGSEVPIEITVGFELGTSTADEKTGMHQITVKLSEPPADPVTVKYAIEGGSATPPVDFDVVTPETMTFEPGQDKVVLEVAVKADTDVTEGNETIDLALVDPSGALIAIGADKHQVTINARALPRASVVAASSANEPTDAVIDVILDETSEFPVTVAYTVAGSATAADHTLVAGQVTFAPGELSRPIMLDVLEDTLDENNETVVVTLTTATNAIVDDTAKVRTHTINDNDALPNVAFSAGTSSVLESVPMATIEVRLSVVSGRNVTVPFTIGAASTATTPADFTIAATSVTIPAGMTTVNITVAIVDDSIDETPNENVVVNLGTTTTATSTGTQTHTLTITDNDPTCYGTSPFTVCMTLPPTQALELPNMLDTSSSNLCEENQPTGWTTTPQSQPDACFILRNTITVTGTTLVSGDRPLVLVASSGISVTGTIDASSNNGVAVADCKVFPAAPANSAAGAGGGAGGSFVTVGGNGGTGDGMTAVAAGTAPTADATPLARLRGGCQGQAGGQGSTTAGTNPAGRPGRGGGAVYLLSSGAITFAATAVVNVSGGGGLLGSVFSGGSGGGSGGMIKVHGATFMATAGSKLVANGGGGASGGDAASGGADGSDPSVTTPTTPAAGGSGGGGSGGSGAANSSGGGAGTPGNPNKGGGGGGGGGGYIQSNLALTNVTTSAGVVSVP